MVVKGLKGFQMVVTGNYNTQHPFGLLGPFSKKMQILLAIANYSLLSTNKKEAVQQVLWTASFVLEVV